MPVVTMPDGAQVRFPDDMPPDQIRAMILSKFPDAAQRAAASPTAPPGPQPAPPAGSAGAAPVYSPANPASPNAQPNAPINGVQWYEPGYPSAPTPAEPLPPALARGTQAVGSGLRKLAFTLPDLAAGGTNIALAGVDKASQFVGGSPMPFRFGMPSEAFAREVAVPAAETVGFPLVEDPEKLPFKERAAFNAADIGTQGMLGGLLLNRLAQIGRYTTIADPNNPSRTVIANAAPRPAPTVGETMLRPYRDRPGITVAGDTAAGAGTGTALTASQALPEDVRAAGGGVVGALADLAAMGAGGVAGGTLANMAVDGPAAAVRYVGRNRLVKDIPLDAEGNPTTRGVADRAARFLQQEAGGDVGARDAARSILGARSHLIGEGMPVPSAGLISDNVGLENLDRGMRAKNPTPFQESDRRLHGAAMDEVRGVRPEGANPRTFTDTIEGEAATRRAAAQGDVDLAQTYTERVAGVRGNQAAEVAAYAGPRQDQAALRADRALVDEGYLPARREKNRQFNEAPGRDEMLPADDLIATAQELRARNNALRRPDEQIPTDVIQRLEALDAAEGGAGVARGGDLANLRGPLADAERRAREAGNPDLADNIGRLRAQINRTINEAPGYAEANANYNQFRQTYRPGPNDPMGEFTRKLDREPFDNRVPRRDTTPPSQTLPTFLKEGRPENAVALRRGLDASQQPAAGVRATGDYLLGELANSGAVRNGALDTNRIRTWRQNNDSILASFPEVRAEIDAVLQRAQRGDVSAQEFGQRLQAARDNARAVERETSNGAFRAAAGNDPDKAVAAIFSSGDPVRTMEQARRLVAGNAPAEQALKAAVADHLYRKVFDIKPQTALSGEEALNFARLTKTLRDSEQTLVAAGFTPDEMAALRRAQRVIAPLAKRAGQATVGSPTAENTQMGERLLEVFYKVTYGQLKGGGMFRNTKLLLGMLNPRGADPALALVQRAMVDPELAATLLVRNVAEAGSPAWNSRLAKTLRRTEFVREVAPSEQDRSGTD